MFMWSVWNNKLTIAEKYICVYCFGYCYFSGLYFPMCFFFLFSVLIVVVEMSRFSYSISIATLITIIICTVPLISLTKWFLSADAFLARSLVHFIHFIFRQHIIRNIHTHTHSQNTKQIKQFFMEIRNDCWKNNNNGVEMNYVQMNVLLYGRALLLLLLFFSSSSAGKPKINFLFIQGWPSQFFDNNNEMGTPKQHRWRRMKNKK